jgi:hypothetical protein
LWSLFPRPSTSVILPEQTANEVSRQCTAAESAAHRQTEQERAIANGAVRFFRLSSGQEFQSGEDSASNGVRDGSAENNDFSITPITVTSYGRLCPRKLVEQYSVTADATPSIGLTPMTQLDGHNHEHDHSISPRPSHEAEASFEHDHRPDEHETSHSIRLHKLVRAKGTWRTRMQRTRCWRCALHDSRVKGWQRIRKMLTWTCFCRFKAYEDDSEDEEREREQRVREMGVRGGLGSTG